MMNKKSLATSFVASLIIILVILAVMLLFEARTSEIYNNLINKNTCKSSVKAQDITTIKNIALTSDIKCPLRRIQIEEKEPEKIKQKFAKAYYDACDEFGQGILNLFGNREMTFCVVRDRISFKEKDIKINDFGTYLAKTNIPGKKLTYTDFCSGFKTERAGVFAKNEIEQLQSMPIDTSKEYAIMFVYIKGEEELREFMSAAFGTSKTHIIQYIGAGLMVGSGILIYTGYGAILGVPMLVLGNIFAGGTAVFGFAGVLSYFTSPDVKMEWASFFLIREFDEQELKKLPCDYLPAEQS